MTSEQRREARYQRRKAKRQARVQARSDALGTIDQVFSYRKMFFYGKKCCTGVGWKQSTQNFSFKLFSGTAKRRRKVLNGTWKQGKTSHFLLSERGKVRPIDAPHINDRQVHKVLTKEVLIPLYQPSMIYANKASQKGGGTHFHYKLLARYLREHYRKYGLNGKVFLMDFHHFFPDAPRDKILERHRKMILDPEIRAIADHIVKATPGERGMLLGVEPSQPEMVALPSALDNYIKAQMGNHGAGHYMDDYHLLFPPDEDAQAESEEVVTRAEDFGLQVNQNKCQLTDISKPFRFCKVKLQLTDTGKVITHGSRDGMKRARRKLKLFRQKVDAGEMTVQEVEQWLQTPLSYYKFFNDHGRVLKLNRMYYAMFVKGETA